MAASGVVGQDASLLYTFCTAYNFPTVTWMTAAQQQPQQSLAVIIVLMVRESMSSLPRATTLRNETHYKCGENDMVYGLLVALLTSTE